MSLVLLLILFRFVECFDRLLPLLARINDSRVALIVCLLCFFRCILVETIILDSIIEQMLVTWNIQVLSACVEEDDCDGLINSGKLFGDVCHVQKSQRALFSFVVRNDQARISIVHPTMSLQKDKVHMV